jgi:prepilin-type N-terminal cleavage/methylation domain-containing protein/prepilin-type processing-associated H-X9-DG protein
MKRARAIGAFTLLELLVVLAIIAVLAALILPVFHRTRDKAKAIPCLGNLRQWGIALHLYTLSNDDFLPREGKPTPLEADLRNPAYQAWYIQLPAELKLPRYAVMPWRTNPFISPGPSVWICPGNPRRCNASSKTNNLFHYCLNDHVDGTGEGDRPTQLSTVRCSTGVIYLFDSKNLPAVGGYSYVHTNLHSCGAQFLFLDGHAARFKNTEYWDFSKHRAITNNPSLVWYP